MVFYNLFILLYRLSAWVLSPFNNKARLWLSGRNQWHIRLKDKMMTLQSSGIKPLIWMHASSLGEFEQGRPILEKIKLQQPETHIVVSFFSPSGYEAMRDYETADIVCYLPLDTAANAAKMVAILNPSLVLWVKYEFWYHHLKAIYKKNIALLLISGIFRKQQPFFEWYGGLHRKMLNFFTHLFLQNSLSGDLIAPLINVNKITVCGDTRFDRVIEIANNWMPVEPVENWLKGAEKVVVAGSTWPEDEEELKHYFKCNPDVKLIIAPHQIDPEMLNDTLQLFENALLFSNLLQENMPETNSNILIINNIGILSRLYKYGHICYIGGGFTGNGVHNILEAAVYGRPVLHGPEYEKYAEAIEMEKTGAGLPIENAIELEETLNRMFTDKQAYEDAAKAAKNYVHTHAGGTAEIIKYVQAKRLLTSL